jgi:hypothetical protein
VTQNWVRVVLISLADGAAGDKDFRCESISFEYRTLGAFIGSTRFDTLRGALLKLDVPQKTSDVCTGTSHTL